MTKKLNITGITNDLEGSAFFPQKKSPTPLPEIVEEQKPQIVKPINTEANSQGVPPPVPHRVPKSLPLIPKSKRLIKQRQPFDIYEDQYVRLKKIADDEREFINGRGMSLMVREAIDKYLEDHGSPRK